MYPDVAPTNAASYLHYFNTNGYLTVWNGGGSGYTVYAQDQIADAVDRLRLMVYDFNQWVDSSLGRREQNRRHAINFNFGYSIPTPSQWVKNVGDAVASLALRHPVQLQQLRAHDGNTIIGKMVKELDLFSQRRLFPGRQVGVHIEDSELPVPFRGRQFVEILQRLAQPHLLLRR